MNEETLKNMPEYVKNLPKVVQDLVFDHEWQSRTTNVASRYSLNPTQTDTLIDNVLYVLIGLEKPENFFGLMTSELGISKLLSEKIISDLESEVFDYALKIVEEKTARKEEFRESIKTGGEILPPTPQPIPDHAPEYRPKKRIVETTKPVPVSLVDVVVKPLLGAEPVQAPVPVPRFTAAPMTPENDVRKPEDIKTPNKSFVENKLSGISTSMKEAPKPYTVDPYREPLE